MTQTDDSSGATILAPDPRPPLRRSHDPKMIAGVCAGFGRYTGIDPLLIRVALVVLTFFGGAGGIIYLAGWLFLPEDGDTASPVEALFGRGSSRTSALHAIILLVIGVAAVSGVLGGRDVVLLVLALAGAVYLARNPRPPALAGPAPASVPPSTAPGATVPLPTAFAPHGPYVDSYGVPSPPPAPPAPVRAPRQRSRLGRIVLSVVVLTVGLLALPAAFGLFYLRPAGYLAAALAVVGAGLVVGAWWGRSRGLIVLGVLLSLALAATGIATHYLDNAGQQTWRPTTVATLAPRYNLSAGEATLDLRKVAFVEGSDTTTRVHVGLGQLTVHVPARVDVDVQAKLTAGHLGVFGEQIAGNGVRHRITDRGTDGVGGGTLHLIISDGLGNVEVTRD